MIKRTLFLLLVLAQSAVFAQVFDEAIDLAKEKIKSVLDSNQIPGLAITVYADGLIWSEGFGYSDLETKSPVIPEISRFRIGSISKTLTSAALAKLYEAGLVDPEADLKRYYNDFPDKGHPLKIKEIAGHLAGIRHYQGDEFLNTKRYKNVIHGLEIFKDSPLLFAPGEKYSYSSYGYNLLSVVVEKVSGKPFLNYMQQEVFSPLEMLHTGPDFPETIISGRVRFYQKSQNHFENCPYVDNSYKWAGGGFLSTSTDLLKFARACMDHVIMSEKTFDLFTTSQKTNGGEETGYGMGWRTAIDKEGRHFVGHSGGSVGGTSMLQIYPDEQVIVIILTNMSQANIGNLTSEIANAFMR